MSTDFYSFRFLVYDVFPVSQQPVFSQSADDDYVRRVETCLDPCGLNWSNEAASTAADDYYVRRVGTCPDPCGLNWSNEAASTAADEDYVKMGILV